MFKQLLRRIGAANWLDEAIGAISPETGLRRARARLAMQAAVDAAARSNHHRAMELLPAIRPKHVRSWLSLGPRSRV